MITLLDIHQLYLNSNIFSFVVLTTELNLLMIFNFEWSLPSSCYYGWHPPFIVCWRQLHSLHCLPLCHCLFSLLHSGFLETRRLSGWIFVPCWKRSNKTDITTLRRHYKLVSMREHPQTKLLCVCVFVQCWACRGRRLLTHRTERFSLWQLGNICSQQRI